MSDKGEYRVKRDGVLKELLLDIENERIPALKGKDENIIGVRKGELYEDLIREIFRLT